jgi:hypothetical protein
MVPVSSTAYPYGVQKRVCPQTHSTNYYGTSATYVARWYIFCTLGILICRYLPDPVSGEPCGTVTVLYYIFSPKSIYSVYIRTQIILRSPRRSYWYGGSQLYNKSPPTGRSDRARLSLRSSQQAQQDKISNTEHTDKSLIPCAQTRRDTGPCA